MSRTSYSSRTLLAAASDLVVGAAVRVRVPAREVILATHRPEGISLHNVVPGTVVAIHVDPAFAHVIVQIAVGSALLLAEVTEDTVARLGIAVGGAIYALIKSVSIDVLPVPEIPAPQGAS